MEALFLLIEAVLLGLVVYRLSRILTMDSISEPWRHWLLRQADSRWSRWGFKLLTCGFCVSVHLSFILVALYVWLVLPEWIGWEYLFLTLATAGAASLMVAVDVHMTHP